MVSLERKICSAAWTSGEAIRNLRELCLRFRGRFSASPDAAGAAEYIESTLKRYGLESAHRHYFPMTEWTRGTAQLAITEPRNVPLTCIALPYAPACDAVLPLVDAGMGHPEDLKKIPGGIAGKAGTHRRPEPIYRTRLSSAP